MLRNAGRDARSTRGAQSRSLAKVLARRGGSLPGRKKKGSSDSQQSIPSRGGKNPPIYLEKQQKSTRESHPGTHRS